MLSSAGWCETMRMCDDGQPVVSVARPGQLSFFESISMLDAQPRELGYDHTIVFFNDCEKFHWEKPDELVDVRSGVICSPNNFAYDEPLDEGMMRITALANFDRWRALDEDAYRRPSSAGTTGWRPRRCASCPTFARMSSTPTCSRRRRSTLHRPRQRRDLRRAGKALDGTTHLKNLFICGTDQGFVGIVGAIISGITMANRHLLARRVHGATHL